MNERVILTLILRRQVFIDVEALHHARNTGRKAARVKIFDEPDARDAVANIAPRVIKSAAHRRDDPHTGYDNASLGHLVP